MLLIAATVALALLGCRSDDIGQPPAGTVFVSVRDSFFLPETVTVVMPGRSVRWTNGGAVYHTVVENSLLWQSNLLPPTYWFEVRFDSSGTFDYHCSQHPGMTGTVIVQ